MTARAARAAATRDERMSPDSAPDTRPFDASGVVPLPAPGDVAALARVELPPRNSGVLEYFAQYTDLQARDPAEIETPEIAWLLLVNGHPLDPYVNLRRILNPWGLGLPVRLRLDRGARLELLVRRERATGPPTGITRVGGRITGRYWFDGG
jgi:hypothetical protein